MSNRRPGRVAQVIKRGAPRFAIFETWDSTAIESFGFPLIPKSCFRRSLWPYVFDQTLEHVPQLFVPLIPIMATWCDVELVAKIALFQQCCEIAICRQQPFLTTTREKQIRRLFWIRGLSKHKGSRSCRVLLPHAPKIERWCCH